MAVITQIKSTASPRAPSGESQSESSIIGHCGYKNLTMEDISNLLNESDAVYYAEFELCSEFDPSIHKKYIAEYYFKVSQ